MRIFNRSLAIRSLLLLAGLLHAADESALRTALDEHRWFDLRDAMLSGPAPPLYRFFLAVAFNDRHGALEALNATARSGAKADQLAPLHFALYRLYYRPGRYRESAAEERQTWALTPDQAPADEASKADLAALEEVSPVTINSHSMRLPIDTGAAISAVTESLAKNLGLRLTRLSHLDGIFGLGARKFLLLSTPAPRNSAKTG